MNSEEPLNKKFKKDPGLNSNEEVLVGGGGGVSLIDLFADDTKPNKESIKASLETLSDLSNPMVMLTFYRRLFPFKTLFKWLNQSELPSKNFTNREFAFTLQNEVYLRYNSFTTAEELKKEIIRLNPSRFEIGPVYTGKPKDKKTLLKSAFKPVLRELVFDIDMTDYDPLRTCCQDKAMCRRCWQFIAVAVEVLDTALRNDFGFKHLLWVYSGRRGIHCWVSDPEALTLNDDQRKAIVNYIEVIKGEKKLNLSRPFHPSMNRALAFLKPYFKSVVLEDQNCFAAEAQWDALLAQLPNKEHASALKKKFINTPEKNSQERWNEVLKPAPRPRLANGSKAAQDLIQEKADLRYQETITDIIIQYTYPRIDTEVSKHLNHLLKSPFCVHPGTGKVCVPIDPKKILSFNPDTVPTVGKLLLELDLASKSGQVNATWESTSLKEYVELFDKHVEGLLKEVRGDRKENISMEF